MGYFADEFAVCIEEDDVVVPLSPAGRRNPAAIG